MDKSANSTGTAHQAEKKISMPQMCIDGLSENWLFKYFGANHWAMLCSGLGTDSTHLQNAEGDRLYASFVRIKIDAEQPLNSFKENEHIQFNGQIQRYGNAMYFSNFELSSKEEKSKNLSAKLMTVFSARESAGNQKLLRSEVKNNNSIVKALNAMPEFGMEYRKIKKQKTKQICLKGYDFAIDDDVVFEKEYNLNPYYDVNGVGLIYFAAYPTISDNCESYYFNEVNNQFDRRWEQHYFTLARDIMYYANCELSDTIIYHLNKIEKVKRGIVKITSSLYRKSDKLLMAKIFTLKKLK
ncbi:MAG: Pnap_2097 family protein [Bacteroidota bacterium]